MYQKDDLLIEDEILDINDMEWIRESTEILDNVKYNVYQGVGNNSLVKLHIIDEILFEL
ncbi:hypothetical protein GCM10012288_24680 [Malaciobacter pacificus]|jgi:hypothetical protein|uniref:Uncharacterized protein n=1 Tax=Malaciobacter pacificus TaxID=1080223 RepID=A0A5C2HF28_9BACT|nr:hypothetical protein [Malaciobacter pacificus]QEP35434.1 hypothetical protein APAC_2374 [Malaciobacter pacificus]GGD49698.1 hypothetical protein GCM10012288_24680 [Malaciobacter pacificus]